MKKFTGILIVLVTVMLNVSCEYITDLEMEAGLTDGLVAYWPVTENYISSQSYGKTIKDLAANNNITLWANGGAGTPSVSCVPGQYSTALSFDGSNDYAQLSSDDLLKGKNTVTVMAWIKSGTMGIIPLIRTEGFNITQDGPWIEFGISNGTISATTGYNSFTTTFFNHVAGVYDGSKIIIYINGTQVSSNNTTIIMKESSTVTLGTNEYNNQFMSGLLDEIRIYNRALSEDEIKKLMTVGVK